MKKARAMAVLVIVAVLVCAAFAISKNSAEKRKQICFFTLTLCSRNWTINLKGTKKSVYICLIS